MTTVASVKNPWIFQVTVPPDNDQSGLLTDHCADLRGKVIDVDLSKYRQELMQNNSIHVSLTSRSGAVLNVEVRLTSTDLTVASARLFCSLDAFNSELAENAETVVTRHAEEKYKEFQERTEKLIQKVRGHLIHNAKTIPLKKNESIETLYNRAEQKPIDTDNDYEMVEYAGVMIHAFVLQKAGAKETLKTVEKEELQSIVKFLYLNEISGDAKTLRSHLFSHFSSLENVLSPEGQKIYAREKATLDSLKTIQQAEGFRIKFQLLLYYITNTLAPACPTDLPDQTKGKLETLEKELTECPNQLDALAREHEKKNLQNLIQLAQRVNQLGLIVLSLEMDTHPGIQLEQLPLKEKQLAEAFQERASPFKRVYIRHLKGPQTLVDLPALKKTDIDPENTILSASELQSFLPGLHNLPHLILRDGKTFEELAELGMNLTTYVPEWKTLFGTRFVREFNMTGLKFRTTNFDERIKEEEMTIALIQQHAEETFSYYGEILRSLGF